MAPLISHIDDYRQLRSTFKKKKKKKKQRITHPQSEAERSGFVRTVVQGQMVKVIAGKRLKERIPVATLYLPWLIGALLSLIDWALFTTGGGGAQIIKFT